MAGNYTFPNAIPLSLLLNVKGIPTISVFKSCLTLDWINTNWNIRPIWITVISVSVINQAIARNSVPVRDQGTPNTKDCQKKDSWL